MPPKRRVSIAANTPAAKRAKKGPKPKAKATNTRRKSQQPQTGPETTTRNSRSKVTHSSSTPSSETQTTSSRQNNEIQQSTAASVAAPNENHPIVDQEINDLTNRRSNENIAQIESTGTANFNLINANMNVNENPLLLFTAALTDTLKTVREAAQSECDSRVGGRVAASKELPEFEGNPLDWVHFLDSYRASTNLCGFSERENIERLRKALRGKARDAVRTLFATTTRADKIIETLELNFGSKHIVASKLIRDMENIPRLASRELNLAQFADRLHNSLVALKSINMEGHLYNPDLLNKVASKLPESIMFAYYRYPSQLPNGAAPLEKLIEFLGEEAKLAKEKGLFELDWGSREKARDARPHESRRPPRETRRAEVFASINRRPRSEKKGNSRERAARTECAFCDKKNHEIKNCHLFGKESGRRRWAFAKKSGLCFVCLENWNRDHICKEKSVCDYCNKDHHNLLHFFEREKGDVRADRDNARLNNIEHNQTENSNK